ncbi:MAG TPA: sugar phosphate isomerase/epimerase family protein [Gemmataceae bacterium]|jgi:L-ribulose-5-phosphate 3-epimerase|nr:sugar phosphate isomerase/epimerase family protein [Gemmataceae bacterium]
MGDSWNRREFMRLGGGTLAAAALGPFGPAHANKADKKRDIHKAVMYGTIGFPGSVMDKLRALKAAGFEGVEPMSHMDQDEVLKALDATRLTAASCCCNTHWDKPLSHPDPRVRKQGLEGLKQALKDANRYGATSVLLVPGVVNDKVSFSDCWKRSIAEIRKAVPVAEKLGVKIAIENVWNNFITKPKQAKEFLDEINSPQVGWHFDIGNTIRYSPPQTWIPVLGKRILKLHIKEYSKAKGFGVRYFDGDDNWPAIMKALDDVGYHGWGIAEQPGDQSKNAAALKDLAARMDRVFAS